MFEIILLTLTVLVAYGGVRREMVHYLGGLNLELSDYQKLIHASRYSRWLDSEERRRRGLRLFSATQSFGKTRR